MQFLLYACLVLVTFSGVSSTCVRNTCDDNAPWDPKMFIWGSTSHHSQSFLKNQSHRAISANDFCKNLSTMEERDSCHDATVYCFKDTSQWMCEAYNPTLYWMDPCYCTQIIGVAKLPTLCCNFKGYVRIFMHSRCHCDLPI